MVDSTTQKQGKVLILKPIKTTIQMTQIIKIADIEIEPTTLNTLASIVKMRLGVEGLAVVQLNAGFLQETINFFATAKKYSGNTFVNSYPNLKINPDSVLKIMRDSIIRGSYLERESGDYYFTLRKKTGTDMYDLQATPKKSTLIQEAYLSGAIIDHKQPVIEYNERGEVEKVTISYCRKGGRWEEKVFTTTEFKRLESYSKKNNSYPGQKEEPKANALYSSGPNGTIDSGFAATKAERAVYSKFVRNPMQALQQSGFAPAIAPDNSEADKYAAIEEVEAEVMPDTAESKQFKVSTHEIIDLPC